MIITPSLLNIVFTAYKAAFQSAFSGVAPVWNRVAMRVPSTTAIEQYGWMGDLPRIREWLGDRVVHGLTAKAQVVKNRTFELTIGVERDKIEDDQFGIYTPLFSEMGRATALFPDELLLPMLKAGFAAECYDGQFFFDTDHPVLDAAGNAQSVSNTGGGAGTGWYLLDTSRMIKPLVFQDRRAFDFVRKDDARDENVFRRNKFEYGVDGRCAGAYGLWQLAYGSKQTLNAANYATARETMMSMTGDYGRPLGIVPNLLVVPPSLESEAKEILQAERNSSGATNIQRGTAELLVTQWVA